MTNNKRQKAVEIRKFLLDMIADARKEARDLTDEEQKLFDEQKSELIALAEEINKTGDKLDEIEAELPDIEDKADEPEEEKPAEPAESQRNQLRSPLINLRRSLKRRLTSQKMSRRRNPMRSLKSLLMKLR
jgi:hypothetical protein